MAGVERTDGSLTVRTLSGPTVLDDLGEQLDRLLSDVGAPITARRPWLQDWIDSFSDHLPWIIAVETSDGELAAAALLARRRRWGVLHIVGLGHWMSDQARLPARSEQAATELAAAMRRSLNSLRGPWRLTIEQLPVADPVAGALARVHGPAELRAGDGSPRVRFDDGRNLDTYASPSLRRRVKRRRNKLRADQIESTVEVISSPEELRGVLPAVELVRSERDRALERFSMLESPGFGAFWRRAIMTHAARGELELVTLRLDGELAAYAVCLLDGTAYRWWDHRFFPDLGRYSPGTLVSIACVERSLADAAFEEFDWMRGLEAHKLECSTDVVDAQDLAMWSSATTARLTKSANSLWARGRTLRDRHPALGRLSSAVKSRLVRRPR